MDIDGDHLDWNRLRAFHASATTGSFSAAARQLGLTQPTLSRQIAALENDLSLLLFERTGRKLILTEAGRDLLSPLQDMARAAGDVGLVASRQRVDLEGWVRITAGDIMAAHVLPPVLAELRHSAPKLTVEVIATNSISNLMQREADIAIRHMRPTEPNLIARLICNAEGYFYGRHDLLDRLGRPTGPEDFERLDWVSYGDAVQAVETLKTMGLTLDPNRCRGASEAGLIVWEMAKAGLGIAPIDTVVGDATPGMERVLPDHGPLPFPIWLVAHRELHTSPRIRLVFDLLANALSRR